MTRTLVAFHAHPDDEALLTSGTMARAAEASDSSTLGAVGGDLVHASLGLGLLLVILVLNVYKPAGMTPYGWRKTHL